MFSKYLTACNTNMELIGPRLVHLLPNLSFIPQTFPSFPKPFLYSPNLSFIPQTFPSFPKPFLHSPNLSFIPQTFPSFPKPFLHSLNLSFVPKRFVSCSFPATFLFPVTSFSSTTNSFRRYHTFIYYSIYVHFKYIQFL